MPFNFLSIEKSPAGKFTHTITFASVEDRDASLTIINEHRRQCSGENNKEAVAELQLSRTPMDFHALGFSRSLADAIKDMQKNFNAAITFVLARHPMKDPKKLDLIKKL